MKSGDRSKQNNDIEEGAISAVLMHLGNISYRLGRTLNFDAAKMQVDRRFGSEQDVYPSVSRSVYCSDESIGATVQRKKGRGLRSASLFIWLLPLRLARTRQGSRRVVDDAS